MKTFNTLLTAALAAGFSLAVAAQPGGGPVGRMDQDGDGLVSSDEFQPPRRGPGAEMLERADADGDGLVSRAEFDARVQARHEEYGQRMQAKAAAMFTEMDANQDGYVSADEAKGQAFNRLDSNADGYISRDEFDAKRERHGKRRGERPGQGSGGQDEAAPEA